MLILLFGKRLNLNRRVVFLFDIGVHCACITYLWFISNYWVEIAFIQKALNLGIWVFQGVNSVKSKIGFLLLRIIRLIANIHYKSSKTWFIMIEPLSTVTLLKKQVNKPIWVLLKNEEKIEGILLVSLLGLWRALKYHPNWGANGKPQYLLHKRGLNSINRLPLKFVQIKFIMRILNDVIRYLNEMVG